MEDICQHLKISKKTLYQYFENKDCLVEKIMDYRRSLFRMEDLKESIKPYSAIQILFKTVHHLIRTLQSSIPSNQFDMKKYHPAVYEKIAQQDEEKAKMVFDTIIEKGIKEGSFRNDIDKRMQIYLICKQIQTFGEPETILTLPYPIEQIVPAVIENFIRNLASAQGLLELEKQKQEAETNGQSGF